MKKHYVLYRHFDDKGNILYIGKSEFLMQRMAQHSINSEWFSEIKTVTLEFYGSRKSLAHAETQAIKKEQPKFNIKSVCSNKKYSDFVSQNKPSKSQVYCSNHLHKIIDLDSMAKQINLPIEAIENLHDFGLKPMNSADIKVKNFIDSSLAKYFGVNHRCIEMLHDIEEIGNQIKFDTNRMCELKLIRSGLVNVENGLLVLSDEYHKNAIAWLTNGALKPSRKAGE